MSPPSGRTFTVACTVNGNPFETKEQKTLYYYGTIAHLDFSAYKSQDTVCVVHTATGDTKIDLAKCKYQLSLLVQRDTTITVTTATRPNVIVADYFGTILGAFEGATSVTVKGNTVTVGDTVITAKDSPSTPLPVGLGAKAPIRFRRVRLRRLCREVHPPVWM